MQLGRYELQECLGGGMALVYRAYDTVMKRTVAVKILRETYASDEARQRFMQEARVAGLLAHENIVRIFDFGEDDQKRPYIVMEFLPGTDLSQAIKEGKIGDIPRKIEIALKVAQALEYIHSQGIIHRDIKPENVSITDRGAVKLMDFGIAKAGDASLTQAGFTLGTPPYMAPEQIRGEAVTTAVDVYAFGVLLFELLTGKRAFTGDSYEQIFYKVLHETPDCEALTNSGASPALCSLVTACIARDPSQRPSGFVDVVTRLEAVRFLQSVPAFTSGRYSGTEVLSGTNPVPAQSGRETDSVPPRGELSKLSWLKSPKGASLAAAGVLAATLLGILVVRAARSSDSLPREITTSTGTVLLVPAGTFLYGEHKERSELRNYYIDRTEVSNGSYAEFCRATGHSLPPEFPANAAGLPVVNVSFEDAAAFAKWAGKRLPTSKEWERAARGTDGRQYSWGDSAAEIHANLRTDGRNGSLLPVNARQDSASPVGAINMIGNVWEFVDEPTTPSRQTAEKFARIENFKPADKWVAIRGLSWREPLDPTVLWQSSPVPVNFRSKYVGFRCVQDPMRH